MMQITDKKIYNREIEIKKIIQIISGILGSAALSCTLPVSNLQGRVRVTYSNSFHSIFFILIGAVCYFRLKETLEKDRRRSGITFFLSFIFALFLVIGERLETLENFNITEVRHYVIIFFCTVFLKPFIEKGWQWLEEGKIKNSDIIKRENSHFIRNSVILFLCWFPVFLAFYPGAFVYDARDEFIQVADGKYTTHHPLIHVLLLGKSLVWGEKVSGSYNAGIVCYTIIQMIITAMVLAYTVEFIRRKNNNRIPEGMILAFYGIFPVIPMYAVCSSKDTYFTVFLLLTMVKLLEFYEEKDEFLKKKRNIGLFILAAALMMLFRNNGIYAYILWIAAAGTGIFLEKNNPGKKKIQYIILLLIPIFLSFVVNKGLAEGLQAQKGGAQEIMTVPIQQLARVYKYAPETFSEEEKEILYEILPKEELHLYTPRISDLLKSKFNNHEFRANPGKYLTLWGKIGIRKPAIYINAWLLTSYGYWYPDGVINVYGGNQIYTTAYEESSYFGFETEPPGIRESKFSQLESFYQKISLELFQQKLPGVSMLFSPGFLFWLVSFFMGYYLWKKRTKILFPLLLPFFVWLTVLAGPTYLVRYVLIWWFAAPLFVSMAKVCYTTTKITDEKISER